MNKDKNEYESPVVFHPGETLKEKMIELVVGPGELAFRSGLDIGLIENIMNGEEDIDSNVAKKLEEVLGISSSFWLGKQKSWDNRKREEKLAKLKLESKRWAEMERVKNEILDPLVDTVLKEYSESIEEGMRINDWENHIPIGAMIAISYYRNSPSRSPLSRSEFLYVLDNVKIRQNEIPYLNLCKENNPSFSDCFSGRRSVSDQERNFTGVESDLFTTAPSSSWYWEDRMEEKAEELREEAINRTLLNYMGYGG